MELEVEGPPPPAPYTALWLPLTNNLYDTLYYKTGNVKNSATKILKMESTHHTENKRHHPKGRTYLVVILAVRSWGPRRVRAGSREEPAGALQEVAGLVQLPDQPSQPRERQSGEEAKS